MQFFLTPLAPFRLDLTVWTLRRRVDNAIDRWDGECYRRVLTIGERVVELAVRQTQPADRPRIEVCVTGRRGIGTKSAATAALERMLGLRVDLSDFYRFAGSQPQLDRLAARFRGMKPPRFLSVFEALVNAIACQQVTLSLGIQLLNKLAFQYASSIDGGSAFAFPRPEDLAGRRPDDFRRLGFSRQKGRAIIELAQSISSGQVDLETLAELDDDKAVRRLRMLRGIGRWSAEYALLRGLGRTHVFPGDDVGARNRLRQLIKPRLRRELDYSSVARCLQRWQPYAGLVYFHLLLDGLAEAGYLSEEETMTQQFKIGDHVEWNSEAGRVRGTIQKKFTSETQFKGYTRHASKDEPQYLIKSDKTDHLAMHKASALKKIRSTTRPSSRSKKSGR